MTNERSDRMALLYARLVLFMQTVFSIPSYGTHLDKQASFHTHSGIVGCCGLFFFLC